MSCAHCAHIVLQPTRNPANVLGCPISGEKACQVSQRVWQPTAADIFVRLVVLSLRWTIAVVVFVCALSFSLVTWMCQAQAFCGGRGMVSQCVQISSDCLNKLPTCAHCAIQFDGASTKSVDVAELVTMGRAGRTVRSGPAAGVGTTGALVLLKDLALRAAAACACCQPALPAAWGCRGLHCYCCCCCYNYMVTETHSAMICTLEMQSAAVFSTCCSPGHDS